MALLLNQRMAVRLLHERGWRIRARARHGIKMERAGRRPVILPRHHGQPYTRRLNGDIVRQAGLDPKEVSAWISRSKYMKRDRVTGRTL